MSGEAQPVAHGERIADLDVLRGVALFGVFLMNFIGFGGAGVSATEAELAALPTARIDAAVTFAADWLVGGKANTTFAFLFGLGFWIQLERAAARGGAFERVYLRRLTVLLAIGIAHTLFLWNWDILHVYALAGFVLFACRRLATRTLLIAGLVLMAVDWHWAEHVPGLFGADWTGGVDIYGDREVAARAAAVRGDDYFATFASMWRFTLYDWLLVPSLGGWIVYALGRFFIGAYVGRQGWLQRADMHLAGFRQVARLCIPAGLMLALLSVALSEKLFPVPSGTADAWKTAGELLGAPSSAILAAGYVSAVVVALRGGWGVRFFAPFRYVGQMALTNYVMQSLAYAFVLFGIWPGLGLAGQIGAAAITAVVVVAFVGQIAFSRWWLARYRFGPLEYVWRMLTYGSAPALRRTALAPS